MIHVEDIVAVDATTDAAVAVVVLIDAASSLDAVDLIVFKLSWMQLQSQQY